MTWPKVILFAIVTAVYTALINQPAFLKDTSFQDIAVNLECWILFALIIILNCKKWWEASLKCFVFFLISQPLIFLIEVPFNSMGFGLFMYYKYWFVITILTLPGAAIAFLVKKKNWLSVLVLSVACCYLIWQGMEYAWSAMGDFPHHLLSAVFCFAFAIVLVFALLDGKSHRMAAIALMAVALAFTVFFFAPVRKQLINLPEGNWTATTEDPEIAQIDSVEGTQAVIHAGHDGTTFIIFTNEEGETVEYNVTVSGGSMYMNAMDN